MRFKSSKGNFTHIYTYIKLEQNFYLVKKNKKKKERRIIENIKHRNPTWLLVHSLFIIIIFFFGLEIYQKSTPTPSPSPPGDCYSIGSSQLPQALWLRGTTIVYRVQSTHQWSLLNNMYTLSSQFKIAHVHHDVCMYVCCMLLYVCQCIPKINKNAHIIN